jgi:single-strand DNA-binding protein
MFSKLVRLGKDAEMATTQSGKQVCKIVAAYDVGWGENKKTVWVDGSWWGDRGVKIAQYLTKGTQIVIHADDVEPDAYQGKNGLQTKLKMNISNVELVARSQQQPGQSYQPQAAPQNYQPQQPVQSAQQQPPAAPVLGDFDDDIPF